MRNLIPIILCGGSGSRLWPLSRESFPKQFIRFNNENSLFQQALIRLYELNNKIKTISKVLILTSEKHRFIVLEQIEDIKFKINFEIILEPDVRNTSPALTFATQLLSKKKSR